MYIQDWFPLGWTGWISLQSKGLSRVFSNTTVQKHQLVLNIQKTEIMASGPLTSWQIDGETVETVADFIFMGSKSLQMVIAAMKLKDAYSLEGKLCPT